MSRVVWHGEHAADTTGGSSMSSLIQLTSVDTGSEVWVNTANVLAITRPLRPGRAQDGALIVLPGVTLTVTETLDEVIALVRRAIEPV